MYSVKDVSEMLEVSRQTIYNYLKDNSTELKGHIYKNKGTTYIDEEGLKVIKVSMGLIQVPTIQENDVTIDNIVEAIKDGIMAEIKADNLKQQQEYELKLIEMEQELKQELKQLKDQNEKLIESNEKLIESMEELTEMQKEKGFLERLGNKFFKK